MKIIYGFLSIFAVFVLCNEVKAAEPFPEYGAVPAFELTNQNNASFGKEQVSGKVWIANFIFTRCQSMCLLLTGQMRRLVEDAHQENIHFVSFSVDPEYDTPEVLEKYAKRFSDSENWTFLTGEKTTVRELIQGGFLVGAVDATEEDLAAGAEAVMHSSRFVLVDQKGEKRGYYDVREKGQLEKLLADARRLSAMDL